MNITYKEIAKYINRTEANIKYMKKHNPEQLEIIINGVAMIKLNLTIKDLEKFKRIDED